MVSVAESITTKFFQPELPNKGRGMNPISWATGRTEWSSASPFPVLG